MLDEKTFHELLNMMDRKTKRNEAIPLTEVAYTKDYRAELVFGKARDDLPYFEIRVYGINDLGRNDPEKLLGDLQTYLKYAAHWMGKYGYTPNKAIGNQLSDSQRSALISEAVIQIFRSVEMISRTNERIANKIDLLENLPRHINKKWNNPDELEVAMMDKLSRELKIHTDDPNYVYVARIAEGWRRLLVLVTGDINLSSKSKTIVDKLMDKELDEIIGQILDKESIRISEMLLH
jgi:Txe/YoeB family toxin of Txe-Axe toxin-antitoxin module